MPEKLQINPQKIKPTLSGPCREWKISSLLPLFLEGQDALDNLPPVKLILDPETQEFLLYDGNHRLTLASMFGVLISAIVYRLGEITEAGSVIERSKLQLARKCQRRATENGYDTFDALANTIPPSLKSQIAPQNEL